MFDTKVKSNGKIDGLWYKNQYEKLWKENNFLEHEKDILNKRIEKAIRLIEEYHYYVFTKDIETIYKNANDEFINILRGDEE